MALKVGVFHSKATKTKSSFPTDSLFKDPVPDHHGYHREMDSIYQALGRDPEPADNLLLGTGGILYLRWGSYAELKKVSTKNVTLPTEEVKKLKI